MKRHKFTKWNKERISVYTSAALVVAVCLISGLYAAGEAPSKKQMIDMEQIQENSIGQNGIEHQPDVADGAMEAPAVVTGSTSDSPMPVAPKIAEEYANRAKAENERRNAMAKNDMDLTGDAEITEEKTKEVMKDTTKEVAQELHFSPEDGLLWPVNGNVILNYSMDERVYLPTLNEYRYYPAAAISAEIGTPVSAVAKGRVDKIGVNEEIGGYLVLDLGDGYEVTIGQMQDFCVEQGDVVSKGQVLGIVAQPTKYYSVEGSNLYVQLKHNKESMDPVVLFH